MNARLSARCRCYPTGAQDVWRKTKQGNFDDRFFFFVVVAVNTSLTHLTASHANDEEFKTIDTLKGVGL